MLTQSEILKRMREVIQTQMKKKGVTYEDVKLSYEAYRRGEQDEVDPYDDEHRELVRKASKAVNEQYGETFEKLGNPLINAKDMLRKSMSENGRTAEDIRRDLKYDPEVMRSTAEFKRRARERE